MFGYITPAQDALSAEDRALFRAYYCAVCRRIGAYSQTARLFLTYDSAFLALLLDALAPEPPEMRPARRCVMHPAKPMPPLPQGLAVDYAAKMSIYLLKYKLKDDAADDKKFLASALAAILPDTGGDFVPECLSHLAEIEARGVKDPDLAAAPFAQLCRRLFTPEFIPVQNTPALGQLGCDLGRWIYLADACEDFEKDKKSGSYNPYTDLEGAEEELYFTLSRVAAAFDLLEIRRYRPLLENIIYAGLASRTRQIFSGGKEKNR